MRGNLRSQSYRFMYLQSPISKGLSDVLLAEKWYRSEGHIAVSVEEPWDSLMNLLPNPSLLNPYSCYLGSYVVNKEMKLKMMVPGTERGSIEKAGSLAGASHVTNVFPEANFPLRSLSSPPYTTLYVYR